MPHDESEAFFCYNVEQATRKRLEKVFISNKKKNYGNWLYPRKM